MGENFSLISKSERRAIFLFALIPALLVGCLFIEEGIYRYNAAVFRQQNLSRGISFSEDDFGRHGPGGWLLVVPVIAVALIRPRGFWISTGLTVLCTILFGVGLYLRIANAEAIGFIRPVWDSIDVGDYFFAAYLALIAAWQFSILGRLSRSRSEQLP